MPSSPDVLSAGAVVLRRGPEEAGGRQVLLVHRSRYDDWSFPKGKLDRGEHRTAAAVREVAEETGLRVRLGPPLTSQRYPVPGRMKTVHYWTARVVGGDDVSGHTREDEIDAVAWVDVDAARSQLTYEYDRRTLAEALEARHRTQPLVVLRHGKARKRGSWHADDRLRPLLQLGRAQARDLTPVIDAYDVRHVVSSSATRCVQTVAPYVEQADVAPVLTDELGEEGATRRSVRTLVADLVDELGRSGRGGLLCSHRPVLPWVFDALGVEDPHLQPGEMLVVHLRKGTVRASERHPWS